MSEYLDRINREYESYTVHSGQKLSGKMFSVNMLSDLTDEEYYARYSNKMLLSETDYEVMNRESSGETNNVPIRPEQGLGQRPKYEIPVRNQGGCGSCWVFAALSAAEKLYFD